MQVVWEYLWESLFGGIREVESRGGLLSTVGGGVIRLRFECGEGRGN